MSTAPRSVTFEEYREKSWHDVCKVLKDHYSSANITSAESSQGNRQIHGTTSNKTWNRDEFMKLPPPPSLDCRQCLVPNRDSVTSWKDVHSDTQRLPVDLRSSKYNILFSKKYVMPSSLVPVSPTLVRPVTFLPPPPTAYRDDIKNDNFSFDTESKSLIEIKRPTMFSSCQSTSGLANGFKVPTTKLTHSSPSALQKRNSQPSDQSKERVCSEIFGIPEVYNPPPLKRLATPRLKLTLPSPRSKQLEGIMPSFLENASSSYTSSPRGTYSEPLIRPEKPDYSPRSKSEACFNQGNEPIKPYHSNILDFLSRKSHGINLDGKYNTSVTSNRDVPFSSQSSQREMTSVHYPIFGKRHDAHESKPGTSPKDMGGAGDVVKSTKLTGHNCLSPRARMPANVVPPAVITPVVASAILEDSVALLKSSEWEDNFEAFSQIFSLTEIHPGLVKNVLSKIIWAGYPHLSSSRTKLARMACICFKRLFQTQRRSMEIEGEKVFYKLLDLCGAMVNNFFQQECKEALSAAVENMDPLKSITFLELHGARHKNPHVREYAAYLLNSIMDEQPVSKLMNKDFSPRIIPMIVGFLKEGLLQTRLTAKLALDKIFDHSTFTSKLRRYVSPENVRHITETLREFKERRNGHGHGHP